MIRSKLLPALTGRPLLSEVERTLLALPSRLGGMGLFDPAKMSSLEYQASLKITQPLTDAILQKSEDYSYEIGAGQVSTSAEVVW